MVSSVYIHIPFCKTICSYCDFCKIYYDKKYISKYLDCLEKEILSRYKGEVINTIYIGGGTPTSLDYEELERLFQIIKIFKTSDNLEYSIESNIECLDEKKILLLKKYGINRVSLGVQSFNDKILKELNRHHTKDQVFDVVSMLKKYDIHNINIDLIYGVTDEVDIIEKDIDSFLELDIPHISCYSLIIEDGTCFGGSNREYIDDDIDMNMYKYICKKLNDMGYCHYEISNYCRDGYESLHNINYWNNGEYYGFGLGAVSYIENNRISNTKSLTKYLDNYYEYEKNFEDKDVRMENEMILGLRMLKGVNIYEFYDKYNEEIIDYFDIDDLIRDKKLIIENGYIRINQDYLYLSNDILIKFIR